jgi:hypothetical protein
VGWHAGEGAGTLAFVAAYNTSSWLVGVCGTAPQGSAAHGTQGPEGVDGPQTGCPLRWRWSKVKGIHSGGFCRADVHQARPHCVQSVIWCICSGMTDDTAVAPAIPLMVAATAQVILMHMIPFMFRPRARHQMHIL